MGKINYKAIYDENKHGWYAMTENPQKYEALLAGHYSDSNHFVYELLQNAEDERADNVVIEYYADKLVFYHNGSPFDEDDVRGVSSMLMGTKDRNDAQTIGRFGMGFKSVFKYTYQPEIYSDEEAFKITSYLLPVEIKDAWDFRKEKEKLSCRLSDGRYLTPFKECAHLTKIVIPFLKYGKNGDLVAVSGEEVLKKLDSLDGRILLFLSHIKSLYWVNKLNGKYANISLRQDAKDPLIVTCRIEGTAYSGKEEITKYLKFKEVFDHPEMKSAEVSVAYKMNSRADNINEVTHGSDIWVYFPTRDHTDLPFLIHGSFETAVSREKLMTPSEFNDALMDKLGDLIASSMLELAERKLITQVFIRRVLIPAFKDEESNETIPGLKEKITEIFKNHPIVPGRKDGYHLPGELVLPAPFKMADFRDKKTFERLFKDTKLFVAFNNEQEANFNDYYSWLVDELGISQFGLAELAKCFCNLNDVRISGGESYSILKEFYEFLWDNRETVYVTGLSFSRSGLYQAYIRSTIKEAWNEIRKQPIVLNRMGKLVAAENDGKPAIYLSDSSDFKRVMQSSLVQIGIAHDYAKLLSECFYIPEFNNLQYVKEKVIRKYIDIDGYIAFDSEDDFTKEYIEDLHQILDLLDKPAYADEIRELLKKAYIIKRKPTDEDEKNSSSFCHPDCCYVSISDEGTDLRVYFKQPVEGNEDDEEDSYFYHYYADWDDVILFEVDEDYYLNNGISLEQLKTIGLITSPVHNGRREMNGTGDGYWHALGEYCPNIKITLFEANIIYINNHNDDLAKSKSIEILKLLLSIANRLKGKKRFRKQNPYDGAIEETSLLRHFIKDYAWLYDVDGKKHNPTEISRHELNKELYGTLLPNKSAYEILGFAEKEEDAKEDTILKVDALNRADKMVLLKLLAKSLGKEVVDQGNDDLWDDDTDKEDTFNPNNWIDDEFPVNGVKNIDYLLKHVQEQFFCADPIKYKKVWRQIRVSKMHKADKAYAVGMYTNSGNTTICQICKKPVKHVEISQIANFGIEMPQLNLCTCLECAASYKAIRDTNRKQFISAIKRSLLVIDIQNKMNDYVLKLNDDISLYFTQTHLAEIQEIIRLLNEYGVPSDNVDDEMNDRANPITSQTASFVPQPVVKTVDEEKMISAPLNMQVNKRNDGIIKRGSHVTYRKPFENNSIYSSVIQPETYPLHKVLLGHKVGDVIIFKLKKYIIVKVDN